MCPHWIRLRAHEHNRISLDFVISWLHSWLADHARNVVAGFLGPKRTADFARPCPVTTASRRPLPWRPLRADSPSPPASEPAERMAPIGFATFFPGERWRRPVHRLEHRRPPRMQVARRGQAESALKRGAQVRDDVTEQVVGDDRRRTAPDPGPSTRRAEHDVVFYLEIKYDSAWGMHHALVAALAGAGNAARTIVISFDPSTLDALRKTGRVDHDRAAGRRRRIAISSKPRSMWVRGNSARARI